MSRPQRRGGRVALGCSGVRGWRQHPIEVVRMTRLRFPAGREARLRRAVAGTVVAATLLGASGARAAVLFDSSTVYPVSSSMGALVVSGDFNGDGKADFASLP